MIFELIIERDNNFDEIKFLVIDKFFLVKYYFLVIFPSN